ncbi:hypothetical protein P7C73_g544, partial [Tremellales sp. Uapishka_1]
MPPKRSIRRRAPSSRSPTDTAVVSNASDPHRLEPSRPSTPDKSQDLAASVSTEPAMLLPHGLSPVTTTVSNHWAYLFYRFCAERHRIFCKKADGVAREDLTEDETLSSTRVGNVFRELDAGSIKMRDDIINVGDQSHEEICFRIFLYCGFYNDSTWRELVEGLGETPSWKTFDLEKYERILHEKSIIRGEKIYYGGFQIVPPTVYFGRPNPLPHYAATLRFIKSLMEMGMPAQLLECRYAVDASAVLQTAPTLGGFMSLNLVCYLNDSPHLHFSYRNFASCGPGSRQYLQRLFGKSTINSVAMEEAGLRWLQENQWRYWGRLGEDPPHAWEVGIRPGMRVLDIENALCWCHRYIDNYEKTGYGNLAQIPYPTYDPATTEQLSASAWCDEEAHVTHRSRPAWPGDYEEEKAKLQSVGEQVYEVEKVVSRRGSRMDKDGLFRIRWKGFPPEDDTWERASSLQEGASEALNDWIEWENAVWGTIQTVNTRDRYRGPRPSLTQSKGGLKGKSQREIDGRLRAALQPVAPQPAALQPETEMLPKTEVQSKVESRPSGQQSLRPASKRRRSTVIVELPGRPKQSRGGSIVVKQQ